MYKLILPKIIVGEIESFKMDKELPLIVTSRGMLERECLARLQKVYPYSRVYANVSPDPSSNDVFGCMAALDGNDMIIGLGGGSVMDVAKVVAQNRKLKKVLIPTIAGSGSEVTHDAVIKISGIKRGIAEDDLVADVAIFDRSIITTLPYSMTDAKAHAIESLGAKRGNNITRLLAREALRLIDEGDIFGSLVAGMAFGNSGTTLCHALSYPLSNRGIPHSEAVAAMLPYAVKFNDSTPLNGVHRVDIDWDIETMATEVMDDMRHLSNNPKPVTYEDVLGIYREAMCG